MSWLYLALGILFEIAGTVSMKLSEGLTRLGPTLAVFGRYAVSFALVALALKRIDLSVAYAIWSGVGTATIAVIGGAYFREPATALRVVSIALIVLGVVGLNLSGVTR